MKEVCRAVLRLEVCRNTEVILSDFVASISLKCFGTYGKGILRRVAAIHQCWCGLKCSCCLLLYKSCLICLFLLQHSLCLSLSLFLFRLLLIRFQTAARLLVDCYTAPRPCCYIPDFCGCGWCCGGFCAPAFVRLGNVPRLNLVWGTPVS